jgi:hypothetical protein
LGVEGGDEGNEEKNGNEGNEGNMGNGGTHDRPRDTGKMAIGQGSNTRE